MKILFYTDVHLMGVSPKHRIDNYPEAMLTKLQEVYDVAKKRQVEFVIFGGDFFNSQRISSYYMINRAMDIICKSGMMTYAVIGQHDLEGYSADTYMSSTLCFMEKHCPAWQTIWEPTKIGKYTLSACHCFDKFPDKLARPRDSEISVLIAHHSVEKDVVPYESYTTKDLETDHDLVLTGHIHEGFETHSIGKTLYCNPGSIARIAMCKVLTNRPIQVALIDYPNIEMIRLDSVRTEEEIFGKTLLEQVQSGMTVDTSKFTNLLAGMEHRAVDLYDLIEKMSSKQNLSDKALNYLLGKRKGV